MRFTILTLIVFCGCASMMQTIPVEERQLIKIYEVPGTSKSEIYQKAISWVAKSFVDSKAVIEVQDKEAGTIIGKGIVRFKVGGAVTVPCRFTLTINIKDDKYRVSFEDLTAMWGTYENKPRPLELESERGYIEQVLTTLNAMAEDLYTNIKSDSEW